MASTHIALESRRPESEEDGLLTPWLAIVSAGLVFIGCGVGLWMWVS